MLFVDLSFFNEFFSAFGAGDLDFSLSSGNPAGLLAFWTGVIFMSAVLCSSGFGTKPFDDRCGDLKEFLIFGLTFVDIPAEHAKQRKADGDIAEVSQIPHRGKPDDD